MPIQWLITFFAIFAVAQALAGWRKMQLDRRQLFLWFFFWVIVLVVIWLPQTASFIAFHLGVGRGVDLVLYISIIVLFYLFFRISRRLDSIERSVTLLVRQAALKEDRSHVRKEE